MLLVSGWACDYRIFDRLNIGYNYLLPVDFSSFKLADDLPDVLNDNGLKKVSALGWSMGAFIIWEFLSKHRGLIDDGFLVSARRSYSKTNNDNIKLLLEKNRRGFLRKFYGNCFSEEDKESFSLFKEDLMKIYLECMDLERLIEGLDYLSEHSIEPRPLNGLKVKFIHGAKDLIAPIGEVKELVSQIPEAELITIDDAGHMPFLSPAFKEVLV